MSAAEFSALLLLFAAYLLSALFSFFQEYTMASVGEKLVLALRQQLSEKITRLPLRYYDNHSTGELLSRTTNDLDRVAEVLKTGLLQFVNGTFNIVLSLVIMLLHNVLLSGSYKGTWFNQPQYHIHFI